MEKEFVPYTEALELKKLGFDEICPTKYGMTSLKLYGDWKPYRNSDDIYEGKFYCNDLCAAPLYQQAFRWFRDEHKLWAYQIPWSGNMYAMTIYRLLEDSETVKTIHDRVIMNTWEEAELECLKKLIEIVKKK